MNPSNNRTRIVSDLCAESGPEDRTDPRRYLHPAQNCRGNRKAWQLCHQVARSLTYALPATGDEILGELSVESVEPAPNGSRLLVTVRSTDHSISAGQFADRLARHRGRLRMEIACDIHRRKLPELVFRVAVSPE